MAAPKELISSAAFFIILCLNKPVLQFLRLGRMPA